MKSKTQKINTKMQKTTIQKTKMKTKTQKTKTKKNMQKQQQRNRNRRETVCNYCQELRVSRSELEVSNLTRMDSSHTINSLYFYYM